MTKSVWEIGGPDPTPSDSAELIANARPEDIQVLPPSPDARVALLLKLYGEDAEALIRLARQRGEPIETVLAQVVHEAAAREPAKR
jgi:hypothetical protein